MTLDLQFHRFHSLFRARLKPLSKGKVGECWEYPRCIPTHTTYIWVIKGCIGQYRFIFWEQLLGYPPKGTQIFPLILASPDGIVRDRSVGSYRIATFLQFFSLKKISRLIFTNWIRGFGWAFRRLIDGESLFILQE